MAPKAHKKLVSGKVKASTKKSNIPRTPKINIPYKSPYVTIDEVNVGDLLFGVSDANGISMCPSVGMVEKINAKSVRLKMIDLSKSNLELVSVSHKDPEANVYCISDAVYTLHRVKNTKIFSQGRYSTMSLGLTVNRELKWSSVRFKRFNQETTLIPEYVCYEDDGMWAGPTWKDNETIKALMRKAGGKVAELLDGEKRKKSEMKFTTTIRNFSDFK